jgi:hypothetical protein
MNKELLDNLMQRHVEDCLDDCVRHMAPLLKKYQFRAEIQEDLLRAFAAVTCDVATKTAELFKEVETL